MLNITTLRTNLQAWVDAQTDSKVIWANQNSPQPEGAHVTLFVDPIAQLGRDGIGETVLVESEYLAVPFGDREFTLAIQAYRSGAYQDILNIVNSLQGETVRATLIANGIAYVRTLDQADISGLLQTQFQERAMADIRFRIGIPYGVVVTEDTGAILKVLNAVGEISGNRNTDPVEIEMTVDAT